MRELYRLSRRSTVAALLLGCISVLPLTALAASSSPYIDPQVYDVLAETGEVRIILDLKRMPVKLPDSKGESRQEDRAKALREQRRQDFAGKFKALINYTQHLDGFELEKELPISLSVIATVTSKRTLDALSRFPHLKAIYWGDKPPDDKVTPSYSTEPDDPYKPSWVVRSEGPYDGSAYRSLMNQEGAVGDGITGRGQTIAVVEPYGESYNEHALTYNGSIDYPSFRVQKTYFCQISEYHCQPYIYTSSHFDGRSPTTLGAYNHHERVWMAISWIAPEAKIIHFSSQGTMSREGYRFIFETMFNLVADGVETIQVLNFSSGSGSHTSPCEFNSQYDGQIRDLESLNINMVAAGGNETDEGLDDPACHPFVTSVAAQYATHEEYADSYGYCFTDADYRFSVYGMENHIGDFWCYSSRADYLDFVAPGAAHFYDEDYYAAAHKGSSFAAPAVAAAMSMVKQANTHLSTSQVRSVLANTSDNYFDWIYNSDFESIESKTVNISAAVTYSKTIEGANADDPIVDDGDSGDDSSTDVTATVKEVVTTTINTVLNLLN